MEWNRSETLALAAPNCTRCHGVGTHISRHGVEVPCKCVFRSIFRACYARFQMCANKERGLGLAILEFAPRGGGKITWARKDEEFAADFYLVARRTLTKPEWKVFSYHFLLGADWRLCCRRLNVERGLFFHAVYRIQAKLGKVFRELEPYSLFPLDEYFNGRTANDWSNRSKSTVRNRQNSLSRLLPVPIRRAA